MLSAASLRPLRSFPALRIIARRRRGHSLMLRSLLGGYATLSERAMGLNTRSANADRTSHQLALPSQPCYAADSILS